MAKHIILTSTALSASDIILTTRAALPQVISGLAAGDYTVRDTSAPVSGTVTAVAAQTVPTAFAVAGWSVATGAGAAQLAFTITTLPSNGGAAITALQYTLDGGTTWIALGAAATGSYTVTAPVAATAYTVAVRAVNAIGNGAASATKSATSGTASTGLSVLSYDSAYSIDDLTTYSFPVSSAGGAVIVGLSYRGSGGTTIAPTSITVDGVNATLIGTLGMNGITQGQAFYRAAGVAAGTVTVVVTLNVVSSRLGIKVWAIGSGNPAAASVLHDASKYNVSSGVPSTAVAAPAGSLVLAIGTSIGALSFAWTGATQREAWANFGDSYGVSSADALAGAGGIAAVSFADDGNVARQRVLSTLLIPAA